MTTTTNPGILARITVVGSLIGLPLLTSCAATASEQVPATTIPSCSTVTVAPTPSMPPAQAPRGGMRAV